MKLLLIKLPELRRLNCLVWSQDAFDVQQWTRIFLLSKIDWLRFTVVTMKKFMHDYLSMELKADFWQSQIFDTAIVTNAHLGICLEARGVKSSRITAAKELDDPSSNEQKIKRQRLNPLV